MTDLTRNQQLVFNALSKHAAPMSAYTILEELRDSGLRAPLQVYRALDKLCAAGLVHRLESVNAFVACRNEGCEHSGAAVFAICDDCGDVAELADEAAMSTLQATANSTGFRLEKTTIELHGACRRCSSQ